MIVRSLSALELFWGRLRQPPTTEVTFWLFTSATVSCEKKKKNKASVLVVRTGWFTCSQFTSFCTCGRCSEKKRGWGGSDITHLSKKKVYICCSYEKKKRCNFLTNLSSGSSWLEMHSSFQSFDCAVESATMSVRYISYVLWCSVLMNSDSCYETLTFGCRAIHRKL